MRLLHDASSSRPDSCVVPAPKTSIIPTIGGPYFALAVLFGMNLLNYIDRYSFFAVGTQIKRDLTIDDKWFGVLGGSFMIVYTIVSPLMGWLGDRYNRRMLLAGGVGLWSLATVGTAFSHDFYHMFFWRALLGVGEASYGVIAPALLADLFAVEKRGRAMGIYYLALPIGTALGFVIAGRVGSHWGWPPVFFVVGLPGLLAALAGLLILDPGRGASEGKKYTGKTDRPRLRDYAELFKTRTFVFNTAGMAAATFATGAYAAWGSTFYQRVRGMSLKEANDSIGILLAIAGLVGIALSTFLADLLRKYTRRAYLLLASVVVLASVPAGYRRHPRSGSHHLARLPVRGIGADGDGARPIEHGHGQRRAGESPCRGLCLVHLPDPSVRRHQLADLAGLDLRSLRLHGGGELGPGTIAALDRSRPHGR